MQDPLMVNDPALADSDKPRVLVAEDNFIIRSNIEDVLTEAGFAPLATENAHVAMHALEEDAAFLRALITDVRLPGRRAAGIWLGGPGALTALLNDAA
jgi:DNA-binding NtrC family response regulator